MLPTENKAKNKANLFPTSSIESCLLAQSLSTSRPVRKTDNRWEVFKVFQSSTKLLGRQCYREIFTIFLIYSLGIFLVSWVFLLGTVWHGFMCPKVLMFHPLCNIILNYMNSPILNNNLYCSPLADLPCICLENKNQDH